MIPAGGQITPDTVEATLPSRTWRLDSDRGRAAGMIDELEAVKQAVHKILRTERFFYLIYNADYGSELSGLFGQSSGLADSELRRRVREALTQDDRIRDVVDFDVSISEDSATVAFTVISTYGDFRNEVTTRV
ncbi:DUF2634 domain-containing protein [Cohnella zeiphila]|uniref:DUF2634 domain-containing protein n=1 Tax=Cohnella zeiphila TaxID=2761120 RepID=A0A7X0VX45_9BACL|nr:DUF2634 domain-containing protein [Cohnella zeiphila]MBB6733180.1 DUF2634 domain-containing protein [Cohnella zeiphila]